ncbi:MAG: TonB-dependent receptor [Marinifilaceae bacterium]|jgi:iron complex outermembrane receptor protein|nr:TonB-dependent receptor [Marinifilaceae bacterium]
MEKLKNSLLLTIVVMFVSTLVCAQNNIEKASIKKDTIKMFMELNEIIVTTQKKEEKLQEIPISISVFNDKYFDIKQIESVIEMGRHIPNTIFFQEGHPSLVSPSIRGIRSSGTSLRVSAGMFVNGVPLLSSAGYEDDLLNIQRVEVLRGPQGTLYGKGAQAGVINIISKEPGNSMYGKASIQVGQDNKRKITFGFNTPILKNKLYFSLSGNYFHKDGVVKHAKTGNTVDDREHWSGRSQIRWTPTNKIEISLINTIRRDNNGGVSGNLTAYGAKTWMLKKPKDYVVNSNIKSHEDPKTNSQSLKISYDISNSISLTSIATRWKYKDTAVEDWDFSEKSIFEINKNNEYERYSEELRLEYNKKRLKTLMGIYFDIENNRIDYITSSILPIAGHTKRDIEGKTYSIFANVDYSLIDKLHIIAGIRYEKETADFNDKIIKIKTNENWYAFSPKIALNYKFSSHIMSYISAAQGYRSGGFNWGATDPKYYSYAPEKLWSYETGIKTTWLQKRLFFNASLFYMNINDMQVEENINPMLFYTTNAAKATSKGVEIEISYNITKGLFLDGGFGYNEIKFDSFTDSQGNYKNNTPQFAPKYTFNLGLNYLNKSGLFIGLNTSGNGKMYFDKSNKFARSPYEIINLKTGYEFKNFKVYVYANNISNRRYDSNGYLNGFYTFYSNPREIGIHLIYKFYKK